MSAEPIVCRYVFTTDEYKTTTALARLARPIHIQLITGVLAVALWCMTAKALFDSISSHRNFTLNLIVPFVILFGVSVWYTSRLLPLRALIGSRSFRKSTLFNLEVSNSVATEGVHSKTSNSESFLKWPGIPKVIEGVDGFAIYFSSKNLFLWLPKHGFSTMEDIDRCRALIQANVPKYLVI